MGKIIDYGTFADRLKAAPNRWDLLREFQEEWGYVIRPGSSRWNRPPEDKHELSVLALDDPDKDQFEDADLTLPVPATLDEWWELPYNTIIQDDRPEWMHPWMQPVYPPTARAEPLEEGDMGPLPDDSDLVAPDADHRVCVFMIEGVYCVEWAYPAAEAHEPDPRVLASVGWDEREWVLQARSLSEFFVQLAVQRLPIALGWSTQVYQEDVVDGDQTELVARIEAELPALGFEPWRELGMDTIVRGGPDVLVHIAKGACGGIFLSGRTPQALLDLTARLGLERTEDELEAPEEY
ncbi:hypothetical protein [Actinomadura harenae]|uniref:Uncharacterized protein n=1 Tax=Actinomadura harenae TaxID=2483351 RepID=A0A3M2M5F4_9ACTN|nr:hypothetical protein [Actinomadura harenae]RMI44722.1 hypothetical protein EBO15_12280 [Actinomadura harenae]